jgi:hypothetical protein
VASHPDSIIFVAQGALGDRVCSEPVVRSVRNAFPSAELHVVGESCFFSHISDVTIHGFDEQLQISGQEVIMNGFGMQDRISVTCIHLVDFISLSTMGRCLCNEEKQITLSACEDSMSRISSLGRGNLLVHCGSTNPSRTFPADWWQEVVDLASKKRRLVLIGRNMEGGKGVLSVDCPPGCVDLRDKTSLEDLIALVSVNDILTNDSFPLHAAGAFDNNIFVIPTARHPDHLLPFRKGSQSHKTKCFFRRLMSDDFVPWGTVLYDLVPSGRSIMDYLPSPKEVAEAV